MGTIGLQIVLERKQSMIHSGELLGERDGLRVIDCAACGFAHLETLPNGASLIEFYRSDFWQKYKAGALDRLLAQYDWWLETYGGWLELVERHVKGRRLFDVGCGYGFLMEAAREMNWNADGIEPNDSDPGDLAGIQVRHVRLRGGAVADGAPTRSASILRVVSAAPG